MTPPPPPGSMPGQRGNASSVVAGVLIGMFVACGISGVLSYVLIAKKRADVRRGWNLVPVVVAAQEIPENTVITFDMISQRSVPEQFVTASVVKPDSAAYVVNQRTLVPMNAGDPLLWTHFETKKSVTRECGALVTAAISAGKEVALQKRLEELRVDLVGPKPDGGAPEARPLGTFPNQE